MMEDFVAYHGLQGRRPRGFAFGGLDNHPEGIHLGTLAQARMRAGAGTVLRVRVRASQASRAVARVRDRDGAWRNLLRRHCRRKTSILVYLNRHEGITLERAEQLGALGLGRVAALSDRQFRKLAPEAEDSWIVLDPALLDILGSVPRRRT